jgi:hypothetical protein
LWELPGIEPGSESTRRLLGWSPERADIWDDIAYGSSAWSAMLRRYGENSGAFRPLGRPHGTASPLLPLDDQNLMPGL